MTIGIASFGEHPVLTAVIDGVKECFSQNGYSGEKVTFVENHVNWDATIVPQMITALQAHRPALIIALTTPVSQTALNALRGTDIPLVFSAVTDPVSAKLVPSWDRAGHNVTGVSDLQDIAAVLAFTRKLMPHARSFGVPYNPGEDNDVALMRQIEALAPAKGFAIVKIGVSSTNDISFAMESLKRRVDVLYVSGSNLLQSAAALISSISRKNKIPTISVNIEYVDQGMFMAAFAVDYKKVGFKTGEIALQVLRSDKTQLPAPVRMTYGDHVPRINRELASSLGVPIPDEFQDCNCFVADPL